MSCSLNRAHCLSQQAVKCVTFTSGHAHGIRSTHASYCRGTFAVRCFEVAGRDDPTPTGVEGVANARPRLCAQEDSLWPLLGAFRQMVLVHGCLLITRHLTVRAAVFCLPAQPKPVRCMSLERGFRSYYGCVQLQKQEWGYRQRAA